MKSFVKVSALLLVIAASVVACANQKEPAAAALKAAQDAYGAISAEAQKYVPEQAKPVQDSLTALADANTKGEYEKVITQATGLTSQISALGAAVAAKKTELSTAWTAMSGMLPELVTKLTSRVEMLGKSKSLPAGITKETFEGAKTGLASITQWWTEATAAAQSGDVMTATTKGAAVKAKVIEVMQSLKMQIPPGVM